MQHLLNRKYDERRDDFLLSIGIITLRVQAKDFIADPGKYINIITETKDRVGWKAIKKKVIALRRVRMEEKDKLNYLKDGGLLGKLDAKQWLAVRGVPQKHPPKIQNLV